MISIYLSFTFVSFSGWRPKNCHPVRKKEVKKRTLFVELSRLEWLFWKGMWLICWWNTVLLINHGKTRFFNGFSWSKHNPSPHPTSQPENKIMKYSAPTLPSQRIDTLIFVQRASCKIRKILTPTESTCSRTEAGEKSILKWWSWSWSCLKYVSFQLSFDESSSGAKLYEAFLRRAKRQDCCLSYFGNFHST